MKEINSYGRLVIIAGPNGSGKSSVTIRLNKRRLLPDLYINPDDIAKEINSSDTGNVQIAAGREAVKLRESYLASGKSFAMETTLSGVSEISFIKKAIAHGYKVTAYFVAVQSVFGNILRVQNRVLKGGHDVPTQDIVRRRERSLQNLPFLIDNLPRVIVYDNSKNIRNFFRKNNNNEIRDEIGIKKYEKDYDADDLKYLYDKKEIKDNTFQINFNKEKMIKMKLKNENKNNEK